jgi:hypothetical protein
VLALYVSLLRLYPGPYRRQFAEEMIAVFRGVEADARNKGKVGTARLYFRELNGLFRGAIAEHTRCIFGRNVPCQLPQRRFTVHSGFRFPKSTAFLMAAILAGVVLAIQKADAIRASVTIRPTQLTSLPTMALMFLGVYVAGALGWVVLFALRRSGVHRLSDMPAAPDRK